MSATPRLVPDHECKQGKCGATTTGCWDRCSIMQYQYPVVYAVTLPAAPAPTEQAPPDFLMPEDAWNEYATRSGLLNECGVAPDPAKTQTAYFAYIAAWNRLHAAFSAYIAEKRHLISSAAARQAPQPKLTLSLPDYETRRIVIASDEVIDGERIVCVAIEGAVQELTATALDSQESANLADKQAGELPVRWANRACADNRRLSDTHYMQAEIDELRAALAARQAPTEAPKESQPAPICWIDPIELLELAKTKVGIVSAIEGDAQRIPLFRHAPDSRDAARYRFVRQHPAITEPLIKNLMIGNLPLDESIDSAIQSAQEKAQ